MRDKKVVVGIHVLRQCLIRWTVAEGTIDMLMTPSEGGVYSIGGAVL